MMWRSDADVPLQQGEDVELFMASRIMAFGHATPFG